MKSRVS
jgi:hypothetical protein